MTPAAANARLRRMARKVRVARAKADRLADAARAATRKAVLGLLAQGISLRDVAFILRISHQRVHQIARAT
jgi:hypothetical protein